MKFVPFPMSQPFTPDLPLSRHGGASFPQNAKNAPPDFDSPPQPKATKPTYKTTNNKMTLPPKMRHPGCVPHNPNPQPLIPNPLFVFLIYLSRSRLSGVNRLA